MLTAIKRGLENTKFGYELKLPTKQTESPNVDPGNGKTSHDVVFHGVYGVIV